MQVSLLSTSFSLSIQSTETDTFILQGEIVNVGKGCNLVRKKCDWQQLSSEVLGTFLGVEAFFWKEYNRKTQFLSMSHKLPRNSF